MQLELDFPEQIVVTGQGIILTFYQTWDWPKAIFSPKLGLNSYCVYCSNRCLFNLFQSCFHRTSIYLTTLHTSSSNLAKDAVNLMSSIFKCSFDKTSLGYLSHAAHPANQFLFKHNFRLWSACRLVPILFTPLAKILTQPCFQLAPLSFVDYDNRPHQWLRDVSCPKSCSRSLVWSTQARLSEHNNCQFFFGMNRFRVNKDVRTSWKNW